MLEHTEMGIYPSQTPPRIQLGESLMLEKVNLFSFTQPTSIEQ